MHRFRSCAFQRQFLSDLSLANAGNGFTWHEIATPAFRNMKVCGPSQWQLLLGPWPMG